MPLTPISNRYWNANGRSVCAVACEVYPPEGGFWCAYIGAGNGISEKADIEWTKGLGCKLLEDEARALFPQFEARPYWH